MFVRWSLLFYVPESDPEELFKINNVTGSITLNRNLTRNSYPLIVTVSFVQPRSWQSAEPTIFVRGGARQHELLAMLIITMLLEIDQLMLMLIQLLYKME